MANYPTSLDTITNPTSGNTLDNPSHSLQHSDANDILEALETKLGIGASPAGSATSGHALVASTGGTTSWTTIGTAGITSGTATSGQVLTANGSSGVAFQSTAQGLTLLIPSSVAVGSGSGSVSATGTITFSGASSVSINDVFSANYTNYLLNVEVIADTFREIRFRLRVAGADNSTTGYQYQNLNGGGSTASALRTTGQTSFQWCYLDGAGRAGVVSEIFNPFATQTTAMLTRTNQFSSVAIENTNNAQAFNATTSFTGFTIYPTAGTITGSIRVYAYNN